MIFFLSTIFNQNWVGAFLVSLVFFLIPSISLLFCTKILSVFSELCPKKGRNQVPRFLLHKWDLTGRRNWHQRKVPLSPIVSKSQPSRLNSALVLRTSDSHKKMKSCPSIRTFTFAKQNSRYFLHINWDLTPMWVGWRFGILHMIVAEPHFIPCITIILST